MTNEERKVFELALEALLKTQNEGFNLPGSAIREAITAIKEALAQPEQEPMANVVLRDGLPTLLANNQIKPTDERLYTTPPQRKPLSDEEMKKIWYAMQNIMGWYSFQEIARAIEAAHGIKE